MPPVRKVRVWQAARMASGIAARSVVPTHPGLMTSGLMTKIRATSTASSPMSGTSG